ncbi:hypothetical protein CWS33_29615 [Escherichia coli]|uniref:Uncharacterized protein n=1 Tax=Escherichia coli TaxID=562 RepID=A0AAP8HUE9_ECOLX|nr:hypothetical protein CWS33_29615 [Escherichia coli]
MEALELEVRRRPANERCVFHSIRCRCFFELCQGIKLGCKTIFACRYNNGGSGCTWLQERGSLLADFEILKKQYLLQVIWAIIN